LALEPLEPSGQEPVGDPCRQHAYQRLVDGGWGQPATTVAGIAAVVAAHLALPGLADRRRGAALPVAALSEGS
jgi:hypothetical protein